MNSFLSRFKTWVKLSVSFGLLIVSLLLVGAFGIYSSGKLGTLLHEMYAVQLSSLAALNQAKLAALSHNRTIYELAAEQDKQVIDDILKVMQRHDDDIRRQLAAYQASGLSAAERKLYDKFGTIWKEYLVKADLVAEPARKGDTAGAMMEAGGQVQQLFQLADGELSELVKLINIQARQADMSGAAISAQIQTVSLVLMAAAVVLGVFNAMVVTRNIVRPLGHAVDELRMIAAGDMTSSIVVLGSDESASMLRSLGEVQSSLSGMVSQLKRTAGHLDGSMHEVTEASEQLSRCASESSNAITNTATAIGDLTRSIELIGNNADAASARAAEAGNAAREGLSLGEAASADVSNADIKVAETASMIQSLSAQMQQIGSIAQVIGEIANQTNLLALNAAIEAARAGEQGRGFAVVADEVRKLAERTTASAAEISHMIAAIQAGTDAAVTSVNHSRSTMEGVRSKVSDTTDAIRRIEVSTVLARAATDEITGALREQKLAGSGIASNVDSVAELSGENARTAVQLSQAMGEVAKVSAALGGIIERFKVKG